MLGDLIKAQRKQRNMTQEELARLIGVKRAVISKYETGDIIPSLEQIKKIANAFNTDVVYLLGMEEGQEKISPDTEPPVSEEEKKEMAVKLYQWLIDTGKVKPGEDLTPQQLTGLLGILDILDALF